jgi:hypothetical protein
MGRLCSTRKKLEPSGMSRRLFPVSSRGGENRVVPYTPRLSPRLKCLSYFFAFLVFFFAAFFFRPFFFAVFLAAFFLAARFFLATVTPP